MNGTANGSPTPPQSQAWFNVLGTEQYLAGVSTLNNFGVGGSSAPAGAGSSGSYATNVNPIFAANPTAFKILAVQYGSNDAFDGETFSVYQTAMLDIFSRASADGCNEMLVATVMDRPGMQENLRTAYNNWIRQLPYLYPAYNIHVLDFAWWFPDNTDLTWFYTNGTTNVLVHILPAANQVAAIFAQECLLGRQGAYPVQVATLTGTNNFTGDITITNTFGFTTFRVDLSGAHVQNIGPLAGSVRLFLGNNFGSFVPSATPTEIVLDGTSGNNAVGNAGNLKFVYYAFTDNGVGFNTFPEYHSTGATGWYVGGVQEMLLSATGTLTLTGSLTQGGNAVANLNSPAFTGTPTVPTATTGTNTTQAASTAFVIANSSPLAGGTTTTYPATGNVGEKHFSYLSSTGTLTLDGTITSPGTTSLSSGTPANVVSINLTAGHWIVTFNANTSAVAATTTLAGPMISGVGSTSATLPTDGTEGYSNVVLTLGTATNTVPCAGKEITLTGSGTVYGVEKATFTAGTISGFGAIHAIRMP